ncbi:MAG: nucleotidyltransferase, partial [Acidobacteria bacterium]|nr:nucleotidyltransferase [Acidobacteriota bacterium]
MHGSLDRRQLTELLDDLSRRLRRVGVRANVYVVGGAAMTLAYRRDRTTHDIDARIDSGHSATVHAVREIARERGLPESWLNEQATSYMPREADARAPTLYNSPYLVVTGASAEHMLAMKLESGRNTDRQDVEVLLGHLEIRDPDEAARIHERLFPDSTRKEDVGRLLRDLLGAREAS